VFDTLTVTEVELYDSIYRREERWGKKPKDFFRCTCIHIWNFRTMSLIAIFKNGSNSGLVAVFKNGSNIGFLGVFGWCRIVLANNSIIFLY
jgi:hypothetical protein